MTNRERENITLSFGRPFDRGAVEETFFPWLQTVEKFACEGLPGEIASNLQDIVNDAQYIDGESEKYLNVKWGESIMNYEAYLGFDPVRRIGFTLPFNGSICNKEDWYRLKNRGDRELARYFTDQNIQEVYGSLKEDHARGDFSIRLNLEGFFWTPRELMGIERHMFAFYDSPKLIHDINNYILTVYLETLTKVIEVLPVDVIYIMEDLSGKNGPMISPDLFDEFIGDYYKRLIPILKNKGAKHIFVDTDGDFNKLIPNFIDAGVEGFLPMDVNAGMDIVKIRKEYPDLKFIGGFNKLCIADGKAAIDGEFERLLPVIRQGGYIPGCDHQVAPSTSLKNYKYYIKSLKEAMKQAGKDAQ